LGAPSAHPFGWNAPGGSTPGRRTHTQGQALAYGAAWIIPSLCVERASVAERWRTTATITVVISPELLEVLACPKCKQKVELSEDGSVLTCEVDRLRYPIVDGIPVMLIEEAQSF
jgi:uncharacterized protein YbaR (Trm112 family)